MSKIKHNPSFSFDSIQLGNNGEIKNQERKPIFKLQSEDSLNGITHTLNIIIDIQRLVSTNNQEEIVNYINNVNMKSENIEPLLLQLDEKSINGGNVLHYASMNPNSIQIIELLIENGANVHSKTAEGYSVTHITSYYDTIDSLMFFVEKYKMDINEKDNNGCTPLHLAAYNNSINSVAYLIFKGANVNEQDNNGMTPLHSSFAKHHKSDSKETSKIIRLLFDHCASLSIKDNLYLTPLDYSHIKHFNFFTKDYPKKHSMHCSYGLISVILFILLLIILPLISCLFVLLPVINKTDYFYAYISFSGLFIIIFIAFLVYPSGYYSPKVNVKTFETLINQKLNVIDFCLLCFANKNQHYHCFQCNKCIDSYYWTIFNKCIGKKNLLLFIILLLIASAFAFFNSWVSLYCKIELFI